MGRRDAVQFTLECAAEWRRLGATVTFEPGWETRGNGTSANYEGCLWHHTASPSSAARPNPTLGILKTGRPDLPGPLCNATIPWCLPEAPHIHVVAANPANHAGASGGHSMGPLPVTSLFNPRVFGCEIDYAGTTAMVPGQRTAAFIFGQGTTRVLKRSIEYARAHLETSVTGKWDIGRGPGRSEDMGAFRRDAAAYTAPQQEDDMPLNDADKKWLDDLITLRLRTEVSDRQIAFDAQGKPLALWQILAALSSTDGGVNPVAEALLSAPVTRGGALASAQFGPDSKTNLGAVIAWSDDNLMQLGTKVEKAHPTEPAA